MKSLRQAFAKLHDLGIYSAHCLDKFEDLMVPIGPIGYCTYTITDVHWAIQRGHLLCLSWGATHGVPQHYVAGLIVGVLHANNIKTYFSGKLIVVQLDSRDQIFIAEWSSFDYEEMSSETSSDCTTCGSTT